MLGVIWHLYRNQEWGMIRGDDGGQVSFRKSALSGVEFRALSAGQRVSYQIREGRLGKEAVDVRSLRTHDLIEINEDLSGGRKKLGGSHESA